MRVVCVAPAAAMRATAIFIGRRASGNVPTQRSVSVVAAAAASQAQSFSTLSSPTVASSGGGGDEAEAAAAGKTKVDCTTTPACASEGDAPQR